MNKVVIYLKASKEAYLGVLGGGLEGEKWCKYIITSIRKEKITMCICAISRSEYVLFCLAMLFKGK